MAMIQVLNEDTIQKIAAGEVIERPVSIVKELVENAIDAGSTEIRVDIKQGGKTYIRVEDNGSGIPFDQIPLALKRHATSKISEFEDLYTIHSLGFRGEALASILAVSKLTVSTKPEEERTGLSISYVDKKEVSRTELAMNRGTVFEVEDLFYNLPVRQKFLKSSQAEGNRINSLMYSLAIGNPKISFRYLRDGKPVFQTFADKSLQENLLLLFGKDYYDHLLKIDVSSDHYKISGFISDNRYYRGNRGMQYLYVNGRYVEDKEITDLMERVYRSIIPNGRFPAYQLFIEVDPSHIDINIHPNKQKIKFSYPEELYESLKNACETALFYKQKFPEVKAPQEEKKLYDWNPKESFDKILNAYHPPEKKKEWDWKKADLTFEKKEEEEIPQAKDEDISFEVREIEEDFGEDFDDLKPIEPFLGPQKEEAVQESMDEPVEQESFYHSVEPPRWIGSIFNTYIFFEDQKSKELLIMDQHAAHERIHFEQFWKEYKGKKVVSQMLFMPYELEVTDLEMDHFRKKKDLLEDLGFSIQEFGERVLLVRSVPHVLDKPEDLNFLRDILDREIEDKMDDPFIDAVIMKSCKASVKQGDALSPQEQQELYRRLMQCQSPFTCPHGRPTIIRVTKYELEKFFMRVK